MATPITWRNVGSNGNGAANRLISDGLDTVGDAFGGIESALRDIQGDRQAVRDFNVDTNTQRFLDTVAGYQDVDSLTQAQQQGVFQNMLSGFGTAVDQEQTRNAVTNQLNKLRGLKTDEIAYNTALDNEAVRQRNLAEAPIVQEFNRLLAAGKNDEATAYLKANEGRLFDSSALYRDLEGEVRGDNEFARTQARQAFDDGLLSRFREGMNANQQRANDFTTAVSNILQKAGVTQDQYINGTLPAEQFNAIKAQIDQVPRPFSQEEMQRRFQTQIANTPGATINDINSLDPLVQDAMNTGLSERQATDVQTQVDAFARANKLEPLSTNMFSTQSQNALAERSVTETGSLIDQAFSDEELSDWDYIDWKPQLIEYATFGIEVSNDKTGETERLRIPPNILADIVKAKKGGAIENDSDFRKAANDFLSKGAALKLREDAITLENEQRRLLNSAKAKANRNNPVYNANQLFKLLQTGEAAPTPEVIQTEEEAGNSGVPETEKERIRRLADELLSNVVIR